jgi:hypothetical protein
MADNLVYELSATQPMDDEPFTRRDLLYVVDENQGSYAGVNQLIYSTSSIANSGRWSSFSEAFLEVPLTVVMSNTNSDFSGDIDDTKGADFLCALKSGYHQIINSISVELNNTTIVQQTNLTNAHISYRLNTQQSLNDVSLNGATNGVFPDGARSWKYATGTSGVRNNEVMPIANNLVNATSGYAGSETFNAGLTERLQQVLDVSTTGTGTGVNGASSLISASNIDTFGKSVVYAKTGTASSSLVSKIWHITAIIRLKDLHPFFEPQNCPLLKGAFFKFYLNLNQSVTSFTYVASPASNVVSHYTVSSSGVNVFGGGTNPLMLCEPNDSAVLTNGKTYKVSVSVVRPIDTDHAGIANSSTKQTSTRLYVPCYTMSPQKEKQYLELHRTKRIKYDDIYQYQSNIEASSSYNILISNGISKLKSVVVLPILQKDTSASGAGALSPIQSPLASEPATCSPLTYMSQFNVQLSGVNAFANNIQYSWESFLTELQSTGLNGNLTRGLCSGLISKEMFEQNYCYLLVDASRRLGQAFLAPCSVQLVGTYMGLKPLQLVTFCSFEREITIDTFTGDIIGA